MLPLTERPQKVYANYNYTCARSASKCRYLRRLYAVFIRYYCARIGKSGQITTGTTTPARHHPGIVPARDGFVNWQKSARFFEKNKNEISG